MEQIFSDFFDKDLYNHLVQNHGYGEIIKLYKSAYPDSTSVKLSFLGLRISKSLELFCDKNNYSIILTKQGPFLRFD